MPTVDAVVRLMIVSSILSLAAVAFLFGWRDPSRKPLWLYSGLGIGLAAYQLLPVLVAAFPGADDLLRRLGWVLSFALPALGYSFLLRFEEIPIGPRGRTLLVPAVAGTAFSAFPLAAARPWLPAAAAICLALLGADFLAALWKHSRRRRPEAPLLFIGTAALLVAVLGEAAVEHGVLLLAGGVPLLLGPAFVLFSALLLVAVADQGRQFHARATTDPLTALPNRASFIERAVREFERSSRTGSSLGVAVLDVDRFKSVNDRFGHLQGDRVLVFVARAIQKTIRGIDLSGRWGGEEFVLLFVDLDEDDAFAALERVRAAIAVAGPPKVPERVTVSAGLAMHHGRFERATVDQLIHRADAALYRAKAEGRNRSVRAAGGPRTAASAADLRYR